MKNIAKKKIKISIDTIFKKIKHNKIYQKTKKMNLIIRISLSLFFFIWFIVGTILMPPTPFGNISLLLSLILLFPLWKVKSKLQYFINKL